MTTNETLNIHEIEVLLNSPEALTALIDFYEWDAAMGEAMGYATEYQDKRVAELRVLRTAAETKRAEAQR